MTDQPTATTEAKAQQATEIAAGAGFSAVSGSRLSLDVFRSGRRYLRFWPHGYESPIELPVITSGSRNEAKAWTWNGSLEKPTLRPSIKTTHHRAGPISHLWLNDGQCQHLADSTDGLAGQTLPLRPLGWQCDLGDDGMDHDWQEKSDSAGECDGLPGQHWTWRECRVCGARDDDENLGDSTKLGAADDFRLGMLHWHPGPARGGQGTAGVSEKGVSQWYDADTLLIIVDVDGGREFAVVHISADEDYFDVRDASTGESYDAWGPESWSWWARLGKNALPPDDENTRPSGR